MRVQVELLVELDDKWDSVDELDTFVRRLVTPYVLVYKSEARREWYPGEFED